MSQKNNKIIRKAALKYANREERKIARYQMEQIYSLPFRYRLMYAIGVIFKFGK